MHIRSGVYRIRNLANGKVYVGSSIDIERRWTYHLTRLRNGKHDNQHLQSAFSKYGERRFEFSVLEYCGADRLLEAEQKHIDGMLACDPRHGYNISPTAGSPLGVRRSEEYKRKSSEYRKGRWTGRSNPFYGRTHSEETRRKISEAGKGRPCSDETRKKRSASLKGLKRSEENRRHLSEAQKGHTPENAIAARKRKVIQIIPGGNEVAVFNSLTEAERSTGAKVANIVRCCMEQRRTAGGYEWRYA